MKLERLRILDDQEIELIHQNSLTLFDEVGIHVDLKKMRDLLADLGCRVDEAEKRDGQAAKPIPESVQDPADMPVEQLRTLRRQGIL